MHFLDAPVDGRGPSTTEGMAGVAAAGARCLAKASRFAIESQDADGAWRMPTQPRILENAVAVCSLAHIRGERAARARARAVSWLRTATPQRHDPFVAAADRWLVEVATADGAVPAFSELSAAAGPHSRRALYLHALACALGAPGAHAPQLLSDTEAALGHERGSGLKPWQRTMLLAFEAVARSALGLPPAAGTLDAFRRAQSADGSYYGMPLVTGMLHLALTRTAPDDPVTHRCRESLFADQHPDGTWRFMVSEVWDTGLMVRALRGHPDFDADALDAAQAFLASAQNEDGGWACGAALDSDNDTTGNTLLALAGTAWADRVRATATAYARRCRTEAGLWTTWHSSDDDPVPDVVAHMVAGIRAASLPGIDLDPARRWLADREAQGHWPSDWYIPPAYGAAEISTLLPPGPHTRATTDALLAAQRPDGGWPRVPGESHSSPAATGLAVTALTHHRTAPREAVERALWFLVDAQTDEGTWTDLPLMYGPRPFLSATGVQIHALTARALRQTLTPARQPAQPAGADR
ncbi:prenyltransferase/squalene oxidase repeat-containing protein [Kitasatospora misakiensis]|uniref:Prenyltransferase/squalene oxidase repeat-containing protein n=1 Tax=Kitasatospora misakiensis TaxID=67330 RepID=A0ABW0XDK7_9ACTN